MTAPQKKGLFHTGCVAMAIAELLTTKSNLRRFALGCCAGWHLYACLYHFVQEPKEMS